MQIIDGKQVSAQIKQEIAAEVEKIIANGGKRPHLAGVLVGHDGGSESYMSSKVKACEQCGFKSSLIRFEEDVTEQQLLDTINQQSGISTPGFVVEKEIVNTAGNTKT